MFSIQEFLGRQKNSNDIAYELIRIFLGVALLTRGVLFMTNQSAVMELAEQRGMDWLLPIMIIHYITLAHLCGGAMMTVGLLTRVAAFVQIPILVGAVFFVHLQDGLFTQGQSFELSVLPPLPTTPEISYGPSLPTIAGSSVGARDLSTLRDDSNAADDDPVLCCVYAVLNSCESICTDSNSWISPHALSSPARASIIARQLSHPSRCATNSNSSSADSSSSK